MKYSQDQLWQPSELRWRLTDDFTGFKTRRPTCWHEVPVDRRFEYIAGREWFALGFKAITSMAVANQVINSGRPWHPVNQVKRYQEHRKVAENAITKFASKCGLTNEKFIKALVAHIADPKRGVPGEVVFAYCMLCEIYSLDPFAGHAALIKGVKPSVTVDGWTHVMNSHPDYQGCEFIDHCDGDDPRNIYAITCKIHHAKRKVPIEVTEYLVECQKNEGPWRTHPRRMLRHRALMQCARVAFGLPIQEVDDLTNGVNSPEIQAGADVVNDFISVTAQPVESETRVIEPPEAQTEMVDDSEDFGAEVAAEEAARAGTDEKLPASEELFPSGEVPTALT